MNATGETVEAPQTGTSFESDRFPRWEVAGADGLAAEDIMEVYSEIERGLVAVAFGGRDSTRENARVNADRIVACVNACRGIPSVALEHGIVFKMIAQIKFLLLYWHTADHREKAFVAPSWSEVEHCDNPTCRSLTNILREIDGKN